MGNPIIPALTPVGGLSTVSPQGALEQTLPKSIAPFATILNLNSPQVALQVDHLEPTPKYVLPLQNRPNVTVVPLIPGLTTGMNVNLGFMSCTGISRPVDSDLMPTINNFVPGSPHFDLKPNNIGRLLVPPASDLSCSPTSTSEREDARTAHNYHLYSQAMHMTASLHKPNDFRYTVPRFPYELDPSVASAIPDKVSETLPEMIQDLKEYPQYVVDDKKKNFVPDKILPILPNSGGFTPSVILPDVVGGVDKNLTLIKTQLQTLLSNITTGNGYVEPKNIQLMAITPTTSYETLKNIITNNNEVNNDRKVYSKGIKEELSLSSRKGRGFAGPGQTDVVNVLTVLSGQGGDNSEFRKNYNSDTGDIIAFYFHDLVNDRYIPFRATVKGINEAANAEWNDVSYVGRADKLYNYKGFSRSINFNFIVVANSLLELLPMWTRINYLVTCVKPSTYTKVTNSINQRVSSFVVPPMMTFTIGDMYKEQPIALGSVSISVPDDAQWETLSENLSATRNWDYLNGIIQLNDTKNKAAQFPRVCNITIDGKLLEQTLPQMGDHNFGSYNQTEDMGKFSDNLLVGDAPYQTKINRVMVG